MNDSFFFLYCSVVVCYTFIRDSQFDFDMKFFFLQNSRVQQCGKFRKIQFSISISLLELVFHIFFSLFYFFFFYIQLFFVFIPIGKMNESGRFLETSTSKHVRWMTKNEKFSPFFLLTFDNISTSPKDSCHFSLSLIFTLEMFAIKK